MNVSAGIEKLDAIHVTSFLEELFGTGVGSVEFLASGAWSRCFGFFRDAQELVVRFGNQVEDFEKDRRAAILAGPAVPVPEISEIGQAFGGHYAIGRRIHGRPLDQLNGGEWRAVLPRVLETADAIRSVDISSTDGYGIWDPAGRGPFGSWIEFLLSLEQDSSRRRIHGWRGLLARSPENEAAFSEAFRLLERYLDRRDVLQPESRHLVHSDLHLNLMVSGSSVTGLIDWGCSLYGDFLYDHAWLAYWAPWYPEAAGIDFVGETIRHLNSVGVDGDLEPRILCCMVNIGLEAIAYNAFSGRNSELSATARRTLDLARSLARS